MAKFNKAANQPTATNFAGGEAFLESPKLELASILLASFATDEFYRSGGATIERIRALVGAIPDREFSARAAVLARREYGMRTVSHVVAAELAHSVKGAGWTKRFFAEVVQRPDDATEVAAYYLGRYGKPFPNSLKKGLALGLAKFDAYQLAKYRAENATVKLVDEDTDEKVTYQIVGEYEASVKEGKVSITSPIARALIGKTVGDTVEVNTPGGGKSYEILEVAFG